ncbi:MAG: glycosyltransferase, partial [Planctomycetota bacterium]
MNPSSTRHRHVMLVSRRFWPHGGHETSQIARAYAAALHLAGCHVCVVTPSYGSIWPERFDFGEIPVFRPERFPKTSWGMGGYQKRLTQWIAGHQHHLDTVLAIGGREEAAAVVNAAARRGCHSVARLCGTGARSDSQWWDSAHGPGRIGGRVRKADRLIIENAATHQAVVAAGVSGERIFRIPPWFPTIP